MKTEEVPVVFVMFIDVHKQFRMEDLEMKKLMLFSLVVAVALLGAQAFASPPVAPPVEGFIIDSFTEIKCDGDVTESESYNWKYFDGEGNLLAPRGVCTAGGTCGTITNAMLALGFAEGAEIAYQQNFSATDGTTNFTKTFKAVSETSTTVPNNLTVNKTITYDNLGGTGFATHLEKVGLSVVSVGRSSSPITNGSDDLLSLCPWATTTNGSNPAYPPTNEGIAAASEFNVKNIVFSSKSSVNTTDNPALKYEVVATGEGTIAAGFVVELWEGPKGDIWGSQLAHPGCPNCYIPEPAPLEASRTSYSESASADGVWSFTKKVGYESVMPTGTPASSFPINQVP
jgi:hypothetical protein